MDAALKGHPYVKTGIDLACWDILGKVAGLPVCTLAGRPATATTSSCIAPSRRNRPRPWRRRWPATARRATGAFQLKVGADPQQDIERIQPGGRALLAPSDKLIADANTGWLMHEAARVVRAVDDVDVYIEQPCLSYEECLSIRRRTSSSISSWTKMVDGLDMLMRGHADQAMDVVNIKISKFGGLTKASLARDLCVSMGVAMTIEDSWGGDITTAAIAHLAHSTPTEFLVHRDRLQQLRHGQHSTMARHSGLEGSDGGIHARQAWASHPERDVIGAAVVDVH